MTTGIKHLLCRDRPFEALDNVKVRERPSPGDPSFPSGHASQAFAIATFLSMRHPQAAVMIPSFLWAGAVGYARVYLGYHYPSDVLGGMVLGAGIAWIVWQNREGIVRWKKRTFGGQNVAITSQREWRGFEIFRLTVPISDVR
jgi:undecaprenyl-diphosphatase